MPDQKTAFESYLKAFMRRRLIFLAAFALAFLGLGALSFTMKPGYSTKSRVAIADIKNMRTPDFLDVYLPGANTFALAGDTYVALIEGLPMADKIAERLGEEGMFVSGRGLASALHAEYFEPDMIEITTTSRDSLRAIAFANAAAEVFVDENREAIRRELSRAVDFIEGELVDAKSEWLQAQQNLADFRSRESIAYLDSWMGNVMQQQAEYDKQLALLETRIEAERAKKGELESLLASGAGVRLNPMEDPVLAGLQEKLVDLESELAMARAEFSEESSQVRLKRAKRDQALAQIKDRVHEIETTDRPVSDEQYYKDLRAKFSLSQVELISLEAEQKGLKQISEATNRELTSLPMKNLEYRQLQLQAQVAEDKLGRLMEKLQEARIQVGGVQGNAAVIDLAVDAGATTTRGRLLSYAAVLSLMLAVGAVFVMEYLDDSLKTTDEMSREVHLTPLGAIPRVKQIEKRLLSPGDQGSPLFESYRIVRSGVRFASVNNPIRQLLLTSSLAGEGKSSTAVNLGIVMAAGGQRVLLVDADLRNPTIHRLMGIEPRIGLTSILLGEAALDDCIITTPYERLSVLPCGPIPPNPVELFESQSLRDLIVELRDYADIVIFDSAPILPVTDSTLLAASLDACVLVLAAGEVTRDDATNARRALENAGARIIGGVLNKVRHGTPEGYYGRYPYNEDGKRGGGSAVGKSRLTKSIGELAGRVTGRND